MLTVAETYRAKRFLSDFPVTGGASEAAKRGRCVRFDDEDRLEGEEKDGNWTEAEGRSQDVAILLTLRGIRHEAMRGAIHVVIFRRRGRNRGRAAY